MRPSEFSYFIIFFGKCDLYIPPGSNNGIINIEFEDKIHKKEFLKKLKIFCSTGGKLCDEGIQLQGMMVDKVIFFLRKDGYEL